MTIRLLATWDGFPPGSIITLSTAMETRFVAEGYASADLTGGTVAYREVEPLRIVPSPRMIGGVHMDANQKSTVEVEEGMMLTVQGSAGVVGKIQRTDAAGVAMGAHIDVTVGTMQAIGPYSGTQYFLITCTGGSIDASVGDDVRQAVVSSSAPVNGDGRPDGTIYVQTV